jgi:hypothetical protein
MGVLLAELYRTHKSDSEEKSNQERLEFLVAPQEFLPFVLTQTSLRYCEEEAC